MYTKKLNTIIGFHGCEKEIGEKLLNGKLPIKKSARSYDWLGHGMYFWENDYDRAIEWAENKSKKGKIQNPFVIGAIIDLGNCLDFIESKNLDLLKPTYNYLEKSLLKNGQELPKNEAIDGSSDFPLRYLDCAVIDLIHKQREIQETPPFDSVRGVFWEGNPPFENSGFRERNHIQVCIRNPNCIKGYFLPRDLDCSFSKP